MRLLLTVLVASAVLSAGAIYAATLSGSVMNRQGEPIAGVNVSIEGSQSAAITDDNGRFTFTTDRRLPLSLTFSHISFQPVMVRVTSGDFLKVEMDYAVYPLQGITVTGNRAAAGLTPIAFTDFTARELERDYLIGEFPLLLEVTPNVYAYTDAGGGLGYSYLRIRGFDDKRVAVYINGVPLNDPEDQATYFVDLPDFASTVKDIQVQRGIGNSLYGDASFGGSVNIVSAGIDQQRHIAVESGFGGFWSGGDWVGDMEKQSFEYHSGLIDGRWNFSGRYSRQISDGYREGSWYNGWAYYLSLSRLDPRMTTTVNVYGGPMRMHLAYYGISRSQIDENRRFNPLTYENETDNFNQPHYEVHNTARLGNRTTLHNTLFHIHGSGYYEQYKKRAKYSAYDLPTDQLQRGDLVRQKWVRKNQWGWNPTLEIEQSRGTLTVGGQFYYFESDHWGQVVWAEGLSNEIAPQHRYYQYYGDKLFGALYAVQTYRATDRLNLTGNLQLRHQSYDFDQVRMGPFPGYDYNVNWTFVSPRLGLTYNINPKTNLLFSYALSSRSPADYEIYEAGDPGAFPSLEVKEVRFVSSTDSTVIFGDPTMKAEKVHNFELGVDVRDDQQAYGVNLFWMEFRDEIVQFGGINEMGLPINTNVDRSVHAGVELSAARKFGEQVRLSGNFSYNYNRIKEFEIIEPVYDNDEDYGFVENRTFDYRDKKIAGFPDYLGNLIAEYSDSRFHLTYRGRLVGRIYVENANVRDLSIDPFFTSSASASVRFGSVLNVGDVRLNVRVDNIFGKKYEAFGYGGAVRFRDVPDLHWAEYIPASERSIFASLRLELR